MVVATLLSTCASGIGATQVEVTWASPPGVGYSQFELWLDDEVVACLPSTATNATISDIAPGTHLVRVAGVVPHPSTDQGIRYRSTAQTVVVSEPAFVLTLQSVGGTVNLTWQSPTSQFFNSFAVSVNGQPECTAGPGFGGSCLGISLPPDCGNVIEVTGIQGGVVTACAAVAYPSCGDQFVRGDCDASGTAPSIADVIVVLGFLFPPGAPPQLPCKDACDSNDDGSLNLGDPIYLLAYLFSGGPTPPEPWCGCGLDPSQDTLGVCNFAPCP